MMPDMKNTLHGSEDDKLLQKLDEAAMKLLASETDRDVLNAIDEAVVAMRKIGLRFAGDKAVMIFMSTNPSLYFIQVFRCCFLYVSVCSVCTHIHIIL